jgi:hypothetical protein
MCRSFRRVALAFLALPLLCIALHAEVILLKNGNKVTGKVTALNGDVFLVKTDYGDIQVPRSDIVSIDFSSEAQDKPAAPPAPAVVDESLVDTIYVNHTYSFQATLPKGWRVAPEIRKQAGPGAVGALNSGDQALFFLVTDEKFSGTLNTYQVLAETLYKSNANFSDYQKTEESQVSLNGRSAVRLVIQAQVKNGAILKFLIYIVPFDGRMVRLTLFTLEPLFAGALPDFEKIAASYKPLAHL